MRMLLVYASTALKQLVKNKGRSSLTMLGIIIGIGSVIFILTTGEIAKSFLLGQITQFGTNVIEVAPPSAFAGFGDSGDVSLDESDVELMYESSLLSEVVAVSAGYTTIETIEHQSESRTVSVFGDRPEVFSVNNLAPMYGRLFHSGEQLNAQRVVVLGQNLAEDLFTDASAAVGQQIKIGGSFFTVLGVVEDLSFGGFGADTVYIPLSTVRRLFLEPSQAKEVSFLLVQFEPGTDVESFRARMVYELKRNHDVLDQEGDVFLVVSREQALDIFDTVLLGIQAFISAVAAISLLVGGIGIMNIMLVTVKERTKEIGLRKAIGARNASVLFQFLVESVVLTTVGGLIGITFGLGLSLAGVIIVNVIQPDWGVAFVFVPNAIALATGVAVTVGLIFGLYPAIKASKLAPIEALRYE